MDDVTRDARTDRARPGGPLGRLGTVVVMVGLFVVVLADQPLGAIFSVLGFVLCMVDLLSPGRDLRGRRT